MLDLRQIQTPTSESWRKSWRKKKCCGSSGCLVFMVIQVGVEQCLFFSTRSRTDGSSSSCEMIILRNKSRGGIIRVCMGIFTTALKKKIQSNSHTPSPSTRSSKTIYWCQETGGLRRGTVCKGGRVNKLVFNRHVYAGRLNSVGFTGKIEFVVNWNETTVYLLEFWVGFVAARSFLSMEFSLLGSSVRKWNVQPWALLMFSYLRRKPRNG